MAPPDEQASPAKPIRRREKSPKPPDVAASPLPPVDPPVHPVPKVKPKPKPIEASARQFEQRDKNRIAIVVALAGACAAIGGSLITGLFEITHIDPRLSNLHAVQMQSQTWGAGYSRSDWNLGPPKGKEEEIQGDPAPREYVMHVLFASPFSYAPHIVVTVSEMDISNKSTLGWIVRAVNVTPEAFDIRIVATEGTLIYGVGGQWVAFQQ